MTQSTIGFFGDSFCADSAGWIDQLGQEYRITHLGHKGCSQGDIILNQWFRETRRGRTPDIAVFVWTDFSRFYHPEFRDISAERSMSGRHKGAVWTAARDYYMHLYTTEWAEIQNTAVLEWFDRNIKTPGMIIHMRAFNMLKHHTWASGVNIVPALKNLSHQGRTNEQLRNDTSPNHMDTDEKNQRIYRAVRQAIDQYQPGSVIRISDD